MWWLLAPAASAEAFLAPLEWPPFGQDVYVVLDDGTRLEGHVSAVSSTGRIPRWTIKDAAKVKHKLEQTRFVEVGVRVEEPPSREAGSIAAALRNAGEARAEIEWVVYRLVPVEPGAGLLLQVVNPGFDRRLLVFPDPFGRDTASFGLVGITVAGGGSASYLAWRPGDPVAVRLDKGHYDEQFAVLFGDCPGFARPDPLKWTDLADHVAEADRLCPP